MIEYKAFSIVWLVNSSDHLNRNIYSIGAKYWTQFAISNQKCYLILSLSRSLFCETNTDLVKSTMISVYQRLHIIWIDHPKSILIKNDFFYLNNMRINVFSSLLCCWSYLHHFPWISYQLYFKYDFYVLKFFVMHFMKITTKMRIRSSILTILSNTKMLLVEYSLKGHACCNKHDQFLAKN